MQPPPDPAEDVDVRVACLTGVVSAALKSPLRLRHLSRWHSMVMRLSTPEWRSSSSARKSTVARLAAHTADDVRGATGEHEFATGECECARDLLDGEAGSGALGHMTASEPS
jgi:hypothetical protein